jgi:hypothetical protein
MLIFPERKVRIRQKDDAGMPAASNDLVHSSETGFSCQGKLDAGGPWSRSPRPRRKNGRRIDADCAAAKKLAVSPIEKIDADPLVTFCLLAEAT